MLKSSQKDSPKVVVFRDSGEQDLKKVSIVGHGADVSVDSRSLEDAFMTLLCLYYVLNVQYPICFCGVLGILQSYYIGDDKYDGFKSNAYKRFVPQIARAVKTVKDQSTDSE